MNRGYCQTKEQYVALRAIGLSDREIYLEGWFGESVATMIQSFRGIPGTIHVFTHRQVTATIGRYRIVSRIIPDWLLQLMKCKNLVRLCAAIP